MNYEIIRDDISKFNGNAVVLPANTKLKEGPGASAAIYEAAGKKELTAACAVARKKYGKLSTGMAVP
ncbi:MAG: macro domain-containing protein, partial [Parasporobacterium sp.]|nr:macro domain-containing protein [Parasporobacterium sp.]